MDTPAASIEFILILFLSLANGFFVLAETAVVEAHKTKLEKLFDAGDTQAERALAMVENPDRILAATQIGITLTCLLIGAIAGSRISPFIADLISVLPLIGDYAHISALVCTVVIIMYFVLILGELLPKQIALNDPDGILCSISFLLYRFETITRPLVHFISQSTQALLFFLGINPNKSVTVTEDEVRTLIEQGTEEGTFEKTEQYMVDRIFRLSDQKAYALMTPRTQMFWIDLEDPLEHNLAVIRKNTDTVFPVARGSLDDFVGILYAKDLLNLLLDKKEIQLEQCIRTPMFIPKSMDSFKVLENFKTSCIHEAVVLDEFGGVIGFLTMHDIIEEVVGDIASLEKEPAKITQRDDNSWLIDGLLSIDEFKEHFEIDELPEEDRDHYQTMGGFITSYLGYLPKEGETFVWNNFCFEIIDMDRARIDKVLLTRLVAETPEHGMAS